MKNLILSTGMGFSLPETEQIAVLAALGWNGIFSGWGGEAHLRSVAAATRKNGMIYQSVHAPFDRSHLLWEAEEAGEKEAERLISCIRDTASVGVPNVVMHAIIGMERHTPTELGIDRFARILDAAEDCGVKVAIENTEGEEYLAAIFDALGTHKALRFCIDTGHEMCYNDCRDLITRYGSHLVCTHLNDNLGRTGEEVTWLDDSHLLPFDGSADWQGIADRLRAVGYAGDLTFELTCLNKPQRNTHDCYAGLDFKAFASLALERAKRLEAMVLHG